MSCMHRVMQFDEAGFAQKKDASLSLNWPPGANLLVRMRLKYILLVPL